MGFSQIACLEQIGWPTIVAKLAVIWTCLKDEDCAMTSHFGGAGRSRRATTDHNDIHSGRKIDHFVLIGITADSPISFGPECPFLQSRHVKVPGPVPILKFPIWQRS